jgi:hypothetical protein
VTLVKPIPFVYSNGGRVPCGFKGKIAGDCVARAIAIAAQMPYAEVYAALNQAAGKERPRGARKRSSARSGVQKPTYRAYLESLGWTFTPTMFIGSGCRVHLRSGELPQGRLIVSLSGHLAAVINGVLYDTHDCSRGGTRCVYGYFKKTGSIDATV